MAASYLLTTGRSSSQDKMGLRSYRATYRVEMSSTSYGPANVLEHAQSYKPDPIPKLWQKYRIDSDFDNYAFCQSRTVEQTEDNKRTWWKVNCEWRPLNPGEDQDDSTTHPMSRPVRYRVEHATYTENIEKDKDGESVVNGAKQEFDTALQQEVSHMVLVATKNFATLQDVIDLNLKYAMHVNTTTFHGASKRKCLCYPISCSNLIREGKVEYYQATFHIEFRDDTWDRRYINQGMKYLKAGVLTNVFAENEDGEEVQVNEPMLLDSAGAMLAANTTGTVANGGILEFRVRDEISFSGLGV